MTKEEKIYKKSMQVYIKQLLNDVKDLKDSNFRAEKKIWLNDLQIELYEEQISLAQNNIKQLK